MKPTEYAARRMLVAVKATYNTNVSITTPQSKICEIKRLMHYLYLFANEMYISVYSNEQRLTEFSRKKNKPRTTFWQQVSYSCGRSRS